LARKERREVNLASNNQETVGGPEGCQASLREEKILWHQKIPEKAFIRGKERNKRHGRQEGVKGVTS